MQAKMFIIFNTLTNRAQLGRRNECIFVRSDLRFQRGAGRAERLKAEFLKANWVQMAKLRREAEAEEAVGAGEGEGDGLLGASGRGRVGDGGPSWVRQIGGGFEDIVGHADAPGEKDLA